jgi:putative alpha-1,2-mannosidase
MIKTENQSEENVYVSKILVNGREVKNHILKHSDIANGGEIIFVMSAKH